MRVRPPTTGPGWIAFFTVLLLASFVVMRVGGGAKGVTSSLVVLWLFAAIFFAQWVKARKPGAVGPNSGGGQRHDESP